MAQPAARLSRCLPRSLHRPISSSTLKPQSRVLLSTTSTARAQGHAPSLSDIHPDAASAFDARQNDFRDRLATAKEQEDSQSAPPLRSLSQLDSSSSPAVAAAASRVTAAASSSILSGQAYDENPQQALGSLSPANTGEHREAARAQERTSKPAQDGGEEGGEKKKGALSTLIYGTEEGREHDREIERSFSQVLARGKYVHSIVFHEVKPDKVDEYTQLVGDWYPKVASDPENKVHLVGSWRTEVGDCDTFGGSLILFNPIMVLAGLYATTPHNLCHHHALIPERYQKRPD